jgi:hypothetical protein
MSSRTEKGETTPLMSGATVAKSRACFRHSLGRRYARTLRDISERLTCGCDGRCSTHPSLAQSKREASDVTFWTMDRGGTEAVTAVTCPSFENPTFWHATHILPSKNRDGIGVPAAVEFE